MPGPAGAGSAGPVLDPVKLLKQYYPALALAFVVGIGLGVASYFVLKYFVPSYTATATYECLLPPDDPRNPSGRIGIGGAEMERFMGTQAQVMVSPLILDRAVADPDFLKTQWHKRFVESGALQPTLASRKLEKEISARTLPQTNLIRLSMSTPDRVDSKIIVDIVDRAYRKELDTRNKGDTAGRREALGRQVDDMKNEINRLTLQRDTVLEQGKIETYDRGTGSDELQMDNLAREIVSVRSDKASVANLLAEYQAKLEANNVAEIPEKLREESKKDPVMVQYEQKIASLRDNEAALRKQGYGAQHPDVVALNANIDASIRKRDEYRDELLKNMFLGQIDQIRTGLSNLEAQEKSLDEKRLSLSTRQQEIVLARAKVAELERRIEQTSKELSTYQMAYNNIQIATTGNLDDRVKLIAPAQIPKELSFPRLKIMVPLGAILITSLVAGLIFLREVLDQRVRGPADAALVPRIKVLGVIPVASEDPDRPANVETAFRDSPNGVTTESFRQLRAPVVQRMDHAGHKTLLVMGGMPGSGATSVASNLAIGCAAAGDNVLIIDANFRRPGMHRVYKLPEGPGLGDVLSGAGSLAEAVRDTSIPNLHVLSAGTPAGRSLPERLSGEPMTRLLAEAAATYDRVFIDSPPAIVAGDGFSIANRCDAVLVVVRAFAEKRGLLGRIRGQLADTRAEFLGVVVNAVRSSAGGYFKRNIRATHQYQQNGRA
jgi:succinoglycan biosynthesis transport protein ExoP